MALVMRNRSRGASIKENGIATAKVFEEGLVGFKSDNFDPDYFVRSKCSLNEKEIKQLCSHLHDLKRVSAEEMRKSVYANYSAFIRTSKEISELEGELSSIRNLLSTQAMLIHSLAEGIHIDSISTNINENSFGNNPSSFEDEEKTALEAKISEFPDKVDALLAERRVDEALAALEEGERIALQAKQSNTLSPEFLQSLETAITHRRQKLSDLLANSAYHPSTRGSELRSAISDLNKLGDGARAHTFLLNAHYQRYQYNMQSLRPSSTSYGGAYTASLSQIVFSSIAQAAKDSTAIFGSEYSSELVVWATNVADEFALVIKRHALTSSAAAAGGLRAAAECVQIALGHCSLLERHGLALSPVLLKRFKPGVEQALQTNLRRIEESTAALVAADDWTLTLPPNTRASSLQYKLTSSAHRFNSMVQEFFEDVGPLLSMQLGRQTLEGLFVVFDSYVSLLVKALPGSIEEEEGSGDGRIVRFAETETQQIALLANASLLADELIPRAAMKLTPYNEPRRPNRQPEQREWRKRLVNSVDRLKDTFCRQHALDLIFSEEGESHLTAEMYINMTGEADEIEWFPSAIFQELFLTLNRLASLAADMFVGRERFATLLLMRLTETVILWLNGDHSFWDEIEDGRKQLGQIGLQQLYLDMKFVIQIASQGRYLSRNLHRVINEIIGRAITAFSATGIDPDSVLPVDDWFNEVCHDAMERLSGKFGSNGENGSPTAHSISSARSQGSY